MEAFQRINTSRAGLPRLCLLGAHLVSILGGVLLAAWSIEGCGGNSVGKSSNSSTPQVTAPSNLTYAMSTLSATVGVPISPDTDSVAGSNVSFSVSPALPAGLVLDSVTGTVSGTPTAADSSANYMITAANSAGSTTATLTIVVVLAKPSNLAYAESVVNDTLGTPMLPDTPTVTGTISSFSINPALPSGLALDPSTGIISGTPKAVSSATVYTVTAENSSGSATTQLTIAVNVSGTVLLEQGHGDPILAIRATTANVLSEDAYGHWVLWDYVSGAILVSGDGANTKDGNQIDLAGQLAVVATAQQVQVYAATDGHLVLTIPTPSWWKLATDGSYVCAGTSTSLTAWSSTGDEAFNLTGDYHAAIAFAAPGQVQLSGGPSGQDVIETDSFPLGTPKISPTFSGTFYGWFLDGQRFLTNLGDTVWIYSSGAVQQALVMLPSISNLTGQGNWIWTTTPGYPSDQLEVYAIGSTTPAQVFPISIGSAYIASGNTIGILEEGTPALSVVDLSGSAPLRSDFQIPPIAYLNSFAAASPSQWIAGNMHGVLVDGASLASTRRYFGFGAVYGIAASSNLATVSTAVGKVLVFNPATAAQTMAIDFFAGKLTLSTDGTVLGAAAEALDLQYATDRTLNLYSLPSAVPSQSFSYSYNDNATPFLSDFSLSGSGKVLGQILEILSPGTNSFERSVTNEELSSRIWSDAGSGTPILLSPDGTLIATATTGGSAATLVTNIYLNGTLVSAVAGTGEGWIDNAHLLVANYVDTQEGAVYSGSSIVGAAGSVLSSIPGTTLPVIQSPRFPAPDRVYDAKTNSIYSLVTGEALWQGPVPQSADTGLGAIAASMVVFEAGHQIVAAPAP